MGHYLREVAIAWVKWAWRGRGKGIQQAGGVHPIALDFCTAGTARLGVGSLKHTSLSSQKHLTLHGMKVLGTKPSTEGANGKRRWGTAGEQLSKDNFQEK